MVAQLKLVGDGSPQEDLLAGVCKDPVVEIFEFWKALMDKPHSQLGAKRRRAIKASMQMGYSLDDLRLAVVGCKYDDWSQGANQANRSFDDIELICRDETRIDRFIELGNEYMTKAKRKDAEAAAKVKTEAARVEMPDYVRSKLNALFSRYKKT